MMSPQIGDTNIAVSMPSQIEAFDIAYASLGESLSDARLVKPCFEHQVELFSLLANRNLNLAIQMMSMSLPHASLHLVFRA